MGELVEHWWEERVTAMQTVPSEGPSWGGQPHLSLDPMSPGSLTPTGPQDLRHQLSRDQAAGTPEDTQICVVQAVTCARS